MNPVTLMKTAAAIITAVATRISVKPQKMKLDLSWIFHAWMTGQTARKMQTAAVNLALRTSTHWRINVLHHPLEPIVHLLLKSATLTMTAARETVRAGFVPMVEL